MSTYNLHVCVFTCSTYSAVGRLVIFHKLFTILFCYYCYYFLFFITPKTEFYRIYFNFLIFLYLDSEFWNLFQSLCWCDCIYMNFKWKKKSIHSYRVILYNSIIHIVVIFVHALTDHILCCGHINNLGYGTKILRTSR